MRLLLNSLELTFSHGGCFVSGITFGSPDRPFDQQISRLSEVAFLAHRAWVAARIVSLPSEVAVHANASVGKVRYGRSPVALWRFSLEAVSQKEMILP